ncbi:uncharacterized protein [Dermacentor andersoni]|uniref:uncharacterized protein n=1 Tax=Dermacentor andersoni TaxID=34620 RepID=UPI003B3B343C
MIFSSTAMLGRLAGMLLYAAAYLLYDPFKAFSPHAAYFIVASVGVEALFVHPVVAYQQAFHMRSEMEAMAAAPALVEAAPVPVEAAPVPVEAAAVEAEAEREAAHAPAEAEQAAAAGSQEEDSGEAL